MKSKSLKSLFFAGATVTVLMHTTVSASKIPECVTPTVVDATLSNKTDSFKIGDCLVPKDKNNLDNMSSDTIDFALAESFGFPKNTYGTWQWDDNCKGLQLLETNVVIPSGTSTPSKCPTGQVAIISVDPAAQGMTQCQMKYGDKWEVSGMLCYKKCREGYVGIGPVCWKQCPDGFKDIGAGCQKPKSYGRGAGNVSKSSCKKHHKKVGCKKYGGLYYPKCRDNYHAFGCCVCSPDCPSGMTDTGADCTKKSYGRGVGKPVGTDTEFALEVAAMTALVIVAVAVIIEASAAIVFFTAYENMFEIALATGSISEGTTLMGIVFTATAARRRLSDEEELLARDLAKETVTALIFKIQGV